jgi:hypothetical protein
VALADPAVAPTLLFGRSKLFKGIKVNIRSEILFSSDSVCVSKILVKTGMQRKSNETIQFVSLFQNYPCCTSRLQQEPLEPEPHRVMAPALQK